jgi:serine/threonine-protein kinase
VIVLILALALKPAAKVQVPRVVGRSEANAVALLQRAGFDPVPALVTTKSPSGIVIGQEPSVGASAAKGSIVRITVSEGPGTTTVPDVVGQGQLAAKSILTKLNLMPVETMIPSDSVKLNHVISTNPGAKTPVPVGSTVAVEVSSGPQLVAVPNLVGKLQAAAEAALKAAQFTSSVTMMDSSQPPGTVLSQSPPVGANEPLGSNVALSVAKAPKTLTLQSLVGETASEASSALSASGLKPTTTSQTVTDASQNGVVVSQQPAAGTKVKSGDGVTLVIGKFSGTTTPTPTTPTTTTPPVSTTPSSTTPTATTPAQ